MYILLKYFTEEIRNEYNIMNIVDKEYLYIEISKGMYELNEAGILAFNYLVENMTPHGYHPVQYTAGSWKHETKMTTSILCVDNFGTKFRNKEDLHHFLDTLRQTYKISTDSTGSNYIGLTIE